MATDPFATATEPDEAQNTNTDTPTESKETTITTAQTAEGKIVTTLKHGSGFEAPWTVVHSNNAKEALETMNEPDFVELMKLTSKIAGQINGGSGNSAQSKPNGQPAASTQAPDGQTPPPGWTYKTGVSKAGKTWKAFMPPRGSDEKPIWL